MEPKAARPKTHVLLVGIDAYAGVRPLAGCVNDIDAIEALLVDRLGVAPGQITRLTAPPKPGPGERLPTRDNLLAALDRLGGAEVAAGDRVFVYYSGHGARVQVADGERRSMREALVPLDATALDGVGANLVFDVELNARLADIAATGAHVTFVLDSCHSGGATRDADGEPGARSITFRSAVSAAALGAPADERAMGTVADVVVVAACAADEIALEDMDGGSRPHGLLTQALLQALAGVSDEALPGLRWGRIWRQVAGAVRERRLQHPSLTGSHGRPVFGGPDQDADTGFGVSYRAAEDSYDLDIGRRHGVSIGARFAVYGSEPLRFPPLGSSADHDARVGTLVVTDVLPSKATASVVGAGPDFALPVGARARLVDPGRSGRLAVAVDPADTELARLVEASPLLRVAAEGAVARVLHRDDGTLVITDDAQRTPADGGEAFLDAVAPGDWEGALASLEHYVRYSAPIRLAAACDDLSGALRLELLDSSGAPIEPTDGRIELSHGAPVAVRVVNASPEKLKVAIVHCRSNGEVALLGELTLAPRAMEVVWRGGEIGRPLVMEVDPDPLRHGRGGRTVAISHLVAIGTTEVAKTFEHLSTRRSTFADARSATRDAPADVRAGFDDGFGGFASAPSYLWTSAHATLRVRGGPDATAALPTIESLFAVPHYALVVGIDAYDAAIGRLSGAAADAAALAAVLRDPRRDDRFEVTLLTDEAATLERIKAAFAELWGKVALEPAARVVLYFAGHGVSATAPDDVGATTPGYFLPQDAVHGTRENWLAMADAQRAIGALGCHHLLLVLDCCFAGAFRWFATRAASPSDRPLFEERVRRYLHDAAWHVITSAAHDEKALDSLDGKVLLTGERPQLRDPDEVLGARSPFARALVMALRGDADLAIPRSGEPDGVLTGSEIQVYIRGRFDDWQSRTDRPLQHPLFFHWPTRSDKGEFVFLNPDPAVPVKLAPAVRLIAANNPYRGLEPHTHDPARPYFFGRDALTRELVAKVEAEPVVAVLGSSGAGKSSLVFAGLLPALAARGWVALPTVRPHDDAARALRDLALTLDPGAAAGEGLAVTVARHLAAHPGERLVAVVDQLEELVTLGRSDVARDAFLAALDAAAAAAKGALRVVYTLRSDFEPQFAAGLLDRHPAGRLRVTAMGRDELREVIERPAEACVLRFDPPSLVDEMVNEVAGAPGALALLSFTLSEMYLRYARAFGESGRDDRSLTLDDYAALGRVEGSLTLQAERVYASLGDEAARRTMRRVLLRMVTVEGAQPAKRRVRESELVFDDPAETARAAAVLAALTDARLVVRDASWEGASAEPAHDRIVLGWPRLRAWIDAPAERARREAVGVLRDWLRNQQGELDRDPRLDGWRALQGGDDSPFNREEGELLRRSVARREDARTRARDQARMFAARGAVGDPTTQAVLLREVARPDANPAWATMALAVLDERVAAAVDEGHTDLVSTVAFSPDGRRVVTSSFDGTARVWCVDGAGAPTTLRGGGGAVCCAMFSPDSAVILTASMDGTLRLWPTGGGAPRVLRGHGVGAVVTAFSRHGGLVVSASHDKTARVWRVDTGRQVACLAHESEVESAAFSWDETLVVTGCRDGTATVWGADGAGPKAVHQHDAPDTRYWNSVVGVAFSPDDARVLSATRGAPPHAWRVVRADDGVVYGAEFPVEVTAFSPRGDRLLTVGDGRVRLWGVDPSAPLADLRAPDGDVRAAAFSADGTRVLVSGDRTTRIWLVDGPGDVTVLRAPDVTLAALSADGALAVTVSERRAVLLWRLGEQGPPPVWRGGGIVAAAIHADGLRVVTCSEDDHVVSVWRAGEPRAATFAGHAGRVRCATFSEDGERLLTGSDDNTAQIWRLDASQPPVPLRGHGDGVHVASFSPLERHVLTASVDGTVRLWDASTGEELAVLSHGAPVFTARFSPRGDRVFSVAGSVAYVWSLRSPPRAPRATPFRREFMESVAISPDGLRIAAAVGRFARLWRRDGTGSPASLAHSEDVDFVLFSPDGRWLVTAARDAVVRVWSVADGALRVELRGHEHWITSASFSQDGSRLATTAYDGSARAWLIESAALVDRLRAATSHELSSTERVERLGESEPEARANRAALLARRRRSSRSPPSR